MEIVSIFSRWWWWWWWYNGFQHETYGFHYKRFQYRYIKHMENVHLFQHPAKSHLLSHVNKQNLISDQWFNVYICVRVPTFFPTHFHLFSSALTLPAMNHSDLAHAHKREREKISGSRDEPFRALCSDVTTTRTKLSNLHPSKTKPVIRWPHDVIAWRHRRGRRPECK